MGSSFLTVMICLLKSMISGHDAKQLQCFLHMSDFACSRNIIPIFLLLYKVICNDAEITLKQIHLFRRQIGNLKQVYLIIVYVGIEPGRYFQPFLQAEWFFPMTIISKV